MNDDYEPERPRLPTRWECFWAGLILGLMIAFASI